MELVCSLCLGGSEGHIVFMSNENQVGVSASTSPPLAGGRGASQKIMKCVAGGPRYKERGRGLEFLFYNCRYLYPEQ